MDKPQSSALKFLPSLKKASLQRQNIPLLPPKMTTITDGPTRLGVCPPNLHGKKAKLLSANGINHIALDLHARVFFLQILGIARYLLLVFGVGLS